MSLRSALKLLSLARDAFETSDGPYKGGTHALTVVEDKLFITINNGQALKSFCFDEWDLDKDPQEFIDELKLFIETNTIILNNSEVICQ